MRSWEPLKVSIRNGMSCGNSQATGDMATVAAVLCPFHEKKREAKMLLEKGTTCTDEKQKYFSPTKAGVFRKVAKGRVEYNFIQNHFHPKRVNFIPNHFHPKPLSSQNHFIQNHFHPKPFSSKNHIFIQNHFHPMTTFITNHFHPMWMCSGWGGGPGGGGGHAGGAPCGGAPCGCVLGGGGPGVGGPGGGGPGGGHRRVGPRRVEIADKQFVSDVIISDVTSITDVKNVFAMELRGSDVVPLGAQRLL